jgi:signal transduction histidine kinase
VNLLGTLIELADSDNGSMKIYDIKLYTLCDLVKSAADSLKDDFHMKNLFFSVNCESEDIFVNVDKDRLEFIIQSLLENALLYSPSGKNVDVTVGKTRNKAVFTVKDNGIGIESADMPNIFTKFYRAKNASLMDTEGVGVSLYLSRSILKRLGGKIDVYSAGAGAGTTSTVTLPLAKKR